MTDIDHRVTRLEFRVDGHDTDIKTMKTETDTLGGTLESIQKILLQIKWLGIGAIGTFVVSQVGLLEVVKHFLGM